MEKIEYLAFILWSTMSGILFGCLYLYTQRVFKVTFKNTEDIIIIIVLLGLSIAWPMTFPIFMAVLLATLIIYHFNKYF